MFGPLSVLLSFFVALLSEDLHRWLICDEKIVATSSLPGSSGSCQQAVHERSRLCCLIHRVSSGVQKAQKTYHLVLRIKLHQKSDVLSTFFKK